MSAVVGTITVPIYAHYNGQQIHMGDWTLDLEAVRAVGDDPESVTLSIIPSAVA